MKCSANGSPPCATPTTESFGPIAVHTLCPISVGVYPHFFVKTLLIHEISVFICGIVVTLPQP